MSERVKNALEAAIKACTTEAIDAYTQDDADMWHENANILRELLSLRTVEEGLVEALEKAARACAERRAFAKMEHVKQDWTETIALLRRHAAQLRGGK